MTTPSSSTPSGQFAHNSGHYHSQILSILKQAEVGTPVPDLCREHGMSSASFYKWRTKYGGMDASILLPLKAKPPFRHSGASQMEVDSGNRETSSALDSEASLGAGVEYFAW